MFPRTCFALLAIVGLVSCTGSPGSASPDLHTAMIPTVHNPVSPMDDQVDILEKRLFARAQCPAHFGLCPSGKLCCPLGGRCCTRGGCCGSGKFCVGAGCCPDTENGCSNKGCCPKKSHCCANGGCCDASHYCVRVGNKFGCCPNGRICD